MRYAQLDILRDSPAGQATAYRIAAETARRDPYWTPEAGEARARHYESEADRIEREGK